MRLSTTALGTLRHFAPFMAAMLLAACAAVPPAPTLAVAQLAPGGTLRAAINYGNPLLATRDATTGEPRGVSVDLARELARRLGVAFEPVIYTAAGKVVEGIKAGAWDVGFFAIDPVRAADTDFSAAYVVIEGAYLVPEGSPIRRNEDVDRPGVRVVVGRGSAYDLYLTRNLKQAGLLRVPTSPEVTNTMVAERIEVAAGVKQQMQADARRVPGLRLLDGRFMEIRQAMAVPKGRAAGAAYVAAFVEEMKASGFIADALKRHGVEGAIVVNPVADPVAGPAPK
ncbi:MAG: ABC transporter substrate-binding protein [Sulfuritalea sp.]|nr:ABC transporter substrate-binding protein [Sulfuritalea sp.]